MMVLFSQGPRGPAGTVGLPGNMVRSAFNSLHSYHVKRWTYPNMYSIFLYVLIILFKEHLP